MLIHVNVDLPGPSSPPRRQLPPQLVQFGTEGLVLIELQGALDVEGSKDGQLVGKLRVDPATNKPTLMIGHHLLEGKLVNLAKPLAVLHRHVARSPGGEEDAGLEHGAADSTMDVDVDADAGGDAERGRAKEARARSWDVVAVVKRKMVFAKRPMPVVGRPAAGSAPPVSRMASKT
ncbi:Ctf8-domain-containing protein [Daedaleopsis nitida]|nr:Ctf8-domain-containing protein [Daedaleopsis nitida]